MNSYKPALIDDVLIDTRHRCGVCSQISNNYTKICQTCKWRFCDVCVPILDHEDKFDCYVCQQFLICNESIHFSSPMLNQRNSRWYVDVYNISTLSIVQLFEVIFCRDLSNKVQVSCVRALLPEILNTYTSNQSRVFFTKPSPRSQKYYVNVAQFGEKCVLVRCVPVIR